jgi:transcription initiation factor IIE alpha subunit
MNKAGENPAFSIIGDIYNKTPIMLLKENAIRKEKLVNGKNRYYNYIFECSGCGKELVVQTSSLKRHSGKCMRCTQLKEPYKYIYNELKLHKRRETAVELTFEEFLEIIKERNCHYCGEDLNYEEYSRVWGKTNSRAHQLDRKNNDLGYTKDNVVTCCWECNRLKSDRFTYEEFIQLSPTLKKIQIERKRKENT